MKKCEWCTINEKNERYHDEEWGVPLFDDNKQFEFLMMEVMQCGLNWNMMLNKREIFRACFDGFDYKKVARYTAADVERIMNTSGMIKSRRKIEAVIHNAKVFEAIATEFGSFANYLWRFTNGKMLVYKSHENRLVAKNALSERVSSDLKKRKMKFMGDITVYSHLQACGIINDHSPDCFRYNEVMRGVQVEYADGE